MTAPNYFTNTTVGLEESVVSSRVAVQGTEKTEGTVTEKTEGTVTERTEGKLTEKTERTV
jgi:hypothetical protein